MEIWTISLHVIDGWCRPTVQEIKRVLETLVKYRVVQESVLQESEWLKDLGEKGYFIIRLLPDRRFLGVIQSVVGEYKPSTDEMNMTAVLPQPGKFPGDLDFNVIEMSFFVDFSLEMRLESLKKRILEEFQQLIFDLEEILHASLSIMIRGTS
ncbi:MAG: hypothetical protein ACTSUE_23615 [Promethearchaeota archaeon]